eukprot:TRINITY_DN16758_c0_g1_i1.p1 TRINITY_DN16758_c0_g1~~TRINITY_DN16758_c0_g1_i1.p1  ORF type:complete len:851 (+),score=360.97 TRINITY_DN16758_c0_g1_i1:74-2554(+)
MGKQLTLSAMFAPKAKKAADTAPASNSAGATGGGKRTGSEMEAASGGAPSPAKRVKTETGATAPAAAKPAELGELGKAREQAVAARKAHLEKQETPAFLEVDEVDEKELPTALTHAKLLKAAAEDFAGRTSNGPTAAGKRDGWGPDEAVPYAFLCNTLADISETGPRLEVSTNMTKCLMRVIRYAPETLLATVYLSLNKLAPAVDGVELGIGDAFLIKCIASGGGLNEQQIKKKYKDLGDLAEIAQYTKTNQQMLVKPKPLTVEGVYATLKQVAMASGKNVQKLRTDWISRMMRAALPFEANFLVRSLQGKMRIGLAEQTVLMALAHAFLLSEVDAAALAPEQLQWLANAAAERLSAAFHEMPSFDRIVPSLLEKGLAALTDVTLTLNLPVKPMLAKPAKGIQMILKRCTDGDFTCEYKYDGERAQIHYTRKAAAATPQRGGGAGGHDVRIFSRNSENHTTKYPDIIEMFHPDGVAATLPAATGTGSPQKPTSPQKAGTVDKDAEMPQLHHIVKEDVTSFIIDSEVVAYDVQEGKIKAFQELQKRARKGVKVEDVTVQVCVFAFDLLYLNGESLLKKPFQERRRLLHESFDEVAGKFQYAIGRDCTETEEIEKFLDESIKGNCEGLMIKTLKHNSQYTPSRRTYNWLKLKKDYVDNVGDSVDLVPIGAWHGKGKRTGCYSAYLLACYDPLSEQFQAICKVGTGFTEENLVALTNQLQEHTVPQQPSYYSVGSISAAETPDVWFSDVAVWEIKAADLSISPRHTAALGLVDPSKGIALRFPRFIKPRDDKPTTEATHAQQIAEMYRAQFQTETGGGEAAADEDDDEY